MYGLECKRCKDPDAIEELCDDCEATVFKRTKRLIDRSRLAKMKAEEICKELGFDTLKILHDMADEVDEKELFRTLAHGDYDEREICRTVLLCLRLCKQEAEREGYAELALISRVIPTNDRWLADQITAANGTSTQPRASDN